MNKQEKIREEIAKAVFDWDYEGINTWEQNCIGRNGYYIIADKVLSYLHSQDVAIVKHFKAGDDLTGASLVWVEPLIKEE